MKHKNKKGQIAETITWLPATILIIIMLAATTLLVMFQIKSSKVFTDVKDEDLLQTKTISAYLSDRHYIAEGNAPSEADGSLVLKLFDTLYKFNDKYGSDTVKAINGVLVFQFLK